MDPRRPEKGQEVEDESVSFFSATEKVLSIQRRTAEMAKEAAEIVQPLEDTQQ